LLGRDDVKKRIPVLVQTNGIRIGKGEADLEALSSRVAQPCLFELSFKGTSSQEFSMLTGRNPDLYSYQLKAYDELDAICRKNSYIKVVAVLGVYHSAIRRNSKSKYVFVEPNTDRPLFDDSTLWDNKFRDIWGSATLKWVERLRMSPKGVWDNLWRLCGPQGSNTLRHSSAGIPTNAAGLFPMKPSSCDYARLLTQRCFWACP